MAVYTRQIAKGVELRVETANIFNDPLIHSRIYVTAVYGYMESDPLYKQTVEAPNNRYIRYNMTFIVNSSEVDKRITAFNIYVQSSLSEVEDFGDFLDSPSEYYLKETVTTDVGWQDGEKSVSVDGIADVNQINLLDALGHAPSFNRERVKPRYITQSRRSQGSVVVIDQDDQTLRLSTYSGFGVHEDENFPNVSVDNLGNPQIIRLNSRGQLQGIEILNEQVLAFKQTELELYDLQSGVTRLLTADCIAPKSILRTPFGVVWAGRSAVYLMPIDGSGIQILNPKWKNLYDGTYDGNPVAGTDIVSGYDPIEQTAWFTKGNKVYRFSFNYNVWNVREFNDT